MYIDSAIRDKVKIDKPEKLDKHQLLSLVEEVVGAEIPYLAYPGEPLKNILDSVEYFSVSGLDSEWKTLSDIERIDEACVETTVQSGCCEGTNTQICLVVRGYGEEPKRYPLFIVKTLDEGPRAFAAMGAIGGVIAYVTEIFLYVNF